MKFEQSININLKNNASEFQGKTIFQAIKKQSFFMIKF